MSENNFYGEVDVDDLLSRMHLTAGERFLLVYPFETDSEITTASGIIGVTSAGGQGDRRGVVLSVGPSNGHTLEAKLYSPFNDGDVILYATERNRGLFDPGLGHTLDCVSQANVMAFVKKEKWYHERDRAPVAERTPG